MGSTTDTSREGPVELADEAVEDRYRRRVGIILALLAITGAWIAVLATDAATAESTTTREATRLAVQAQSADVLAKGVEAARSEIEAEVDAFDSREVFSDPDALEATLGIEIDPARAAQRRAAAEEQVESAFSTDGAAVTELAETAAALSLEQKATVDARITWNAKASQYETVLTTLAIAVFLVGFTLVIGRRLRPPVAVPGMFLAVFCIGWAGVIYSHPIPEVDQDAIDATAAGKVALSQRRAEDARSDFTVALESQPDYLPALWGRALATLLAVNPDVLDTMAVTDTSQSAIEPAARDMQTAMDNGGDQDPQTLAVAALARTLAGDWDAARDTIDSAIDLNENGVELYLWRAAVSVALGDSDEAQHWLDEAQNRFSDLDGDRRRELVAQYFTVLEVVSATTPDQAQLATEFTEQAVAAATEASVGRALDPSGQAPVTLDVVEATFADDTTTLRFSYDGIPNDAAVAIVGYERPAPGATWVQPAELFYAGEVPSGGEGVTINTPRSCAPVEYRFDLYVEGQLVDSVTSPGVDATC